MQHLLRRKINYFIIIFLVSPFIGFAQLRESLNQLEFDQKDYHFGINVGFNQSHFNFSLHPLFLNQDSVLDVESINSTGINLAWLVDYKLSEHFDFRTFPLDLVFAQRTFEYSLQYPDYAGGETPITDKNVQSITLSLPLQIKFTSDRIDNLEVYTIGGVKFDYDLAASNSADKNIDAIIKLNKFNYGVEGGFGFHLFFQYFVLTPELKVDWGIANLHNYDPTNKFSNVIDKIRSRMITFSLTIE
jgi:hypothetical protein